MILSLQARCLQSKSHLMKTLRLVLANQLQLIYGFMCVSTLMVMCVCEVVQSFVHTVCVLTW